MITATHTKTIKYEGSGSKDLALTIDTGLENNRLKISGEGEILKIRFNRDELEALKQIVDDAFTHKMMDYSFDKEKIK